MKKILRSLFLLGLLSLIFALPANAAEQISIDAKSYSAGTPTRVDSSSVSLAKNAGVGFKINFSTSPSEVTVTIGNDKTHAGDIEVRLDSSGGKLLGTAAATQHASWSRASYSIPVSEDISGAHTVWVIYKGIQCDFYSISFLVPDPSELYDTFAEEEDAFVDIADSKIRTEINLLADLDILDTSSDSFDGERLISKREFLRALGGFYQSTANISSAEQPFSDVAVSDPDYGLIVWLCTTGVLESNPSGQLSPDGAVTLDEACDMLVRMLGFEDEAYHRGSSVVMAKKLDLLTGVSISNTGRLKNNDMAQLLWNTVDSKYNDLVSISEDGYFKYQAKDQVLDYTGSIRMAEGIISATQNNNLYSNENVAPSASVIIDEESYKCGTTNAARYFGMNCIYFYEEQNGIKTLVAIRPSLDTDYIYLSSADTDFKEISDDAVTYYKENSSKLEEPHIDSAAIIMYNGRRIDDSLENLIGSGDFTGTVLLIDNDGNKKYDVIFVEHAETIIFGGLTETTVYDLLRNQTRKYNDTSEIRLLYGKTGGVWDNLALGTVLDVYESKNKTGDKLIRMYPASSTVTGVVKKSENDGTLTMEDGTEYKKYRVVKKDDVIIGKEITLKLNGFNQYVDYTIGTYSQLGLVLDTAYVYAGFKNDTVIKMLGEDNEIKEYSFADRVYADGVLCKTPEELNDGKDTFKGLGSLAAYSIVIYSINSNGKITMIDTEKAGAGGVYDVLTQTASKAKYQIRGSYLSEVNSDDLYTQNAVLRNNYKILTVSTTGNEKEHCFQNSIAGGDRQYILTGYGTTSADSFITDLIVTESGYSTSVGNHFIVTGRYLQVTDGGETEIVIEGISASGNVTYIVDDYRYNNSDDLKNAADTVSAGDMIQVSLNSNNRITGITVNYFHDGAKVNSAGVAAKLNSDNGYVSYDWSRGRIYLGEVIDSEDGYVKIKAQRDNGSEAVNYLNAGSLKLLACDIDNNRCTISAAGTGWVGVGQKIIVCQNPYAEQPNMAVIYR